MIDHIGIKVSSLEQSKRFYEQMLESIGYCLFEAHAEFAGFGRGGKPDFWIHAGEAPTATVHVAFRASERNQVETFYAAAIAAGARDNGPPGLRDKYHPNYFGAFVLDPDGNNIEVVCHDPESCKTDNAVP